VLAAVAEQNPNGIGVPGLWRLISGGRSRHSHNDGWPFPGYFQLLFFN